jgi:hypothetical protein
VSTSQAAAAEWFSQDHHYKSNKGANCAIEKRAQMRLSVKAIRIKILLVQYQSDNWTT